VLLELAERDRIRNPAAHPFGLVMGISIPFQIYGRTIVKVRFSLLTIGMLGIGILTRYSGVDATMG